MLATPAPEKLSCLAFRLRGHRTRVQNIYFRILIRFNNLKRQRPKRLRQSVHLVLIRLATERDKRDTIALRFIQKMAAFLIAYCIFLIQWLLVY